MDETGGQVGVHNETGMSRALLYLNSDNTELAAFLHGT